MELKCYAILDILLGSVVLSLQVTFYKLVPSLVPFYISPASWGGIIFFITGIVEALSIERWPVLRHVLKISMAATSILTGIYMAVFFLWLIVTDNYDLFDAVDSILIAVVINGILAVIINAFMIVKVSKQLQESLTPYHQLNSNAVQHVEKMSSNYDSFDSNVYTRNSIGTFQQVKISNQGTNNNQTLSSDIIE